MGVSPGLQRGLPFSLLFAITALVPTTTSPLRSSMICGLARASLITPLHRIPRARPFSDATVVDRGRVASATVLASRVVKSLAVAVDKKDALRAWRILSAVLDPSSGDAEAIFESLTSRKPGSTAITNLERTDRRQATTTITTSTSSQLPPSIRIVDGEGSPPDTPGAKVLESDQSWSSWEEHLDNAGDGPSIFHDSARLALKHVKRPLLDEALSLFAVRLDRAARKAEALAPSNVKESISGIIAVESALARLREMDLPLTERDTTNLITAYLCNRDQPLDRIWHMIRQYWPRIFWSSLRERGGSMPMDEASFVPIMDSAIRVGSPEAISRIFVEMKNFGTHLSASLGEAFMMSHRAHADPAGARSLMERLENEGVVPTKRTFELLTVTLSRAGEEQDIAAALKTMECHGYSSAASLLHERHAALKSKRATGTWKPPIDVTEFSFSENSDAFIRLAMSVQHYLRHTPSLPTSPLLSDAPWPFSQNSLWSAPHKLDDTSASAPISTLIFAATKMAPNKRMIPFSILHNYFARTGDAFSSLKLLSAMRTIGSRPDSGIYGTVMKTILGSASPHDTLTSLELVAKVQHLMTEDGVREDRFYRTHMLEAYLDADDLKSAAEVLGNILRRNEVDAHVVTLVSSRLRRLRGGPEALAALGDFAGTGDHASAARSVWTWALLIRLASPAMQSIGTERHEVPLAGRPQNPLAEAWRASVVTRRPPAPSAARSTVSDTLRESVAGALSGGGVGGTLAGFMRTGLRADRGIASAAVSGLAREREGSAGMSAPSVIESLRESVGLQVTQEVLESAADAAAVAADLDGLRWAVDRAREPESRRMLVATMWACLWRGDAGGARRAADEFLKLGNAAWVDGHVAASFLRGLLVANINALDENGVSRVLDVMRGCGIRPSSWSKQLMKRKFALQRKKQRSVDSKLQVAKAKNT